MVQIWKKGNRMIMKLLRWNKTIYNMENLFGSDFRENCKGKR